MKQAMKKSTRQKKAAKLLKDLPPGPSAAAARWDATCSAEDYVRQAQSAFDRTMARLSAFRELDFPDNWLGAEVAAIGRAEKLLYEAKFKLLEPSDGLERLLNRDNWASERPRISIGAWINQQGNLVARWTTPELVDLYSHKFRLKNTTGLRAEFFLECWYHTEPYGALRPPSELLWFRSVPTMTNQSDHPVVRYIMYAIRAKFEAMINEIAQSLEVATHPNIGFARDDETGLEMTLA